MIKFKISDCLLQRHESCKRKGKLQFLSFKKYHSKLDIQTYIYDVKISLLLSGQNSVNGTWYQ